MKEKVKNIFGIYYPAVVYLTLVPKFYLNEKKKKKKKRNSTFWKVSNVAICHITVALNINLNRKKALKILAFAENVNFKGSGLIWEVKFFFSDNGSPNILRLIYKV